MTYAAQMLYLWATYAVHLRLIGKLVADILFVLNVFRLGVVAEALRANINGNRRF